MAIQIPQGLLVVSKESIDSRIVLTKEEMLAVKPARMPDVYFAMCKDDGKMYTYNKGNEIDPETGRFRLLGQGSPDEQRNAYDSISKIEDFVYETTYSDLDYDYANNWFKHSNDTSFHGACSSFRNGNWYGRNFDWFYNNQANFIIKTPRMNGKYASIGRGGNVAELTVDAVDSGDYYESYKIIPFKLLDGINEYGVFANTNVVPGQKDETTGTIPTGEQTMELCNLAIPRFVLDNFKTAEEAINYITEHVSIYCYSPLYTLFNEDVHVMIGDENKTFVMEFVNNEIVVNEFPIMTNFFIDGVTFNEDGSVYTPKMYSEDNTKNPVTVNGITCYGNGLERYNLINESLESVIDKDSARELLTKLFYTNSYKDSTDPRWYSELAGIADGGDLKLDDSIDKFEAAYEVMKAQYAERSRETGDTWQTVHSCVYDIKNRKIYCIDQESEKELEINFDYYTSSQVDTKLDAFGESLANIAKTGMAHDLLQEEDEYLILNCNF